MLKLFKRLLLFRIGQRMSRRVARTLGYRATAPLFGIVGGFKYMRRHS